MFQLFSFILGLTSSLTFTATAMNANPLKELKKLDQKKNSPQNPNISFVSGVSSFENNSHQKQIVSFASNAGSSIPKNQQTQDNVLISTSWLQSQEGQSQEVFDSNEKEIPLKRSQTHNALGIDTSSYFAEQKSNPPSNQIEEKKLQQQNPAYKNNAHYTQNSHSYLNQSPIQERKSENMSSTDSENQSFVKYSQEPFKENALSSTFSEPGKEKEQKSSIMQTLWKWGKFPIWMFSAAGLAYLGMYYCSPWIQSYTYTTLKKALSSAVFKCEPALDVSPLTEGIKISIEGMLYHCSLK